MFYAKWFGQATASAGVLLFGGSLGYPGTAITGIVLFVWWVWLLAQLVKHLKRDRFAYEPSVLEPAEGGEHQPPPPLKGRV